MTFNNYKTLVIFWSCVLLSYCLAACAKPPTQARPPATEYSWYIKKRSFQEKNLSTETQIDISYPEIHSTPLSIFAQTINQNILSFVNNHMATFSARIHPDNNLVKDLPPQMRHNALKIRYWANLIRGREGQLWSVQFHVEKIFSGQTIPAQQYAVMNYDLAQEKMLTLASLFKPNTDYLKIIAAYCSKKLPQQMQLDMPWIPGNAHGILPLAENYQIWNLKKDGLVITFQTYQIEPYSNHTQAVLVPYAMLRSLIGPTSPIVG